jgi:DNA polymerase I-like protein with 3'-5' exonuclease and polymerase domains/uracil-DNA glycosylase
VRHLPVLGSTPKAEIEMCGVYTEQKASDDSGLVCDRCALHEGVVTNCLAPEQVGPDAGDTLLVVLPPPLQLDDKRGTLQGSATWQYLTRLLPKHWKGPIVFDSAVRCSPGAKKKVTPAHIAACRGHIASTIQEANPSRIILMGSEATTAFFGSPFPVDSLQRGQVLLSTGTPVFFLPWPLAALRNTLVQREFEDTLTWAITATPRQRPTNAVVLQVKTLEDAALAVEDLTFSAGMTVDVETFGLSFKRGHKILSLAATPIGSEVAYVWGANEVKDPQMVAGLLELLQDHTFEKRGTNFKFDVIHIQSFFKILVDNVGADYKILRKLWHAESDASLEFGQTYVGMYGGKELVEEHIRAGVTELKRLAKKGGTSTLFAHTLTDDELAYAVEEVSNGESPLVFAYAAIPPDERDLYNGYDTISTDKAIAFILRESPAYVRDVWDAIVADMNHGITAIQFNGIRVDKSRVSELRVEMDGVIANCEKELYDNYGPLNVNSSAQVGHLLFETLKLKPKGKTATGKWQVTSSVLEELQHPAAKLITKLKQAGKFKSQYADGMEAFVQDDGRIHADININGAGTGRPSCSSPNMFNIPRTSGAGKKCRSIFVPTSGYELSEGDYNQLELRVAAMISRDPVMTDIFVRGVDYHLETAKLIAPMMGIDPATLTKEHVLRERAKTTNFALLFGDSAAGVAAKLGISKASGEQLVGAILGALRVFAAWVQARVAEGNRTGIARTRWDGRDFRTRQLYDIAGPDDEARATAERCFYNTPIQGTGADFMHATIGRMQRIIDGSAKRPDLLKTVRALCETHEIDDPLILDGHPLPARLVMTVYDSLLSETRPEFTDTYMRLTRAVATSWNSLGVPLRMDFKRGSLSWGEMEKVE